MVQRQVFDRAEKVPAVSSHSIDWVCPIRVSMENSSPGEALQPSGSPHSRWTTLSSYTRGEIERHIFSDSPVAICGSFSNVTVISPHGRG